MLSECTLVLVHPEREDELRLPAQVVMVTAAGVGLSLASSYLTQLDSLEAFAAPSPKLDTFVPEPPSEAVQPIETLSACQTPSAEPQLTVGFFLSTLLPPKGPTTVVCPTPSVKVFVPV